MKKTLLTLVAGIASLVGTGAQAATMEYGYCGDANIALSMRQKCCYNLAIEIPAEFSEALKGSKLTGLNVGFGVGSSKNMTIYAMTDLGEEYIATGSTTTLTEREYNMIKFDTPVTLDGTPLFVGFSYDAIATDTPLAFDNDVAGFNPLGDYVDITTTAAEAWKGDSYGRFGGQYGNACIRAVIEGDNFPADMAMPRSINLPGIIRPWTDFDFTVDFRNLGTEAISSVEVSYSLGHGGTQKKTISLDTPVAVGANGQVTLTGRNNEDGEVDLLAQAYITKINGNDNPLMAVMVEEGFSPSNKQFERRMVLEEYTGVGCQFCPRGWYGIEEFKKELAAKGEEDNFIAIAVHNYGADPMQCSAYNTWVNNNITGAPQGTVNRSTVFEQFDPSLESLREAYPLMHVLCDEYIGITANYEDETESSVVAEVEMRFAKDIEKANYGLAYVVIQNDLGPYNQMNGFAGGRYGEMGGFENQSTSVPLMFNDVARDIYNWAGDKTACPSTIEEGETYTHTKTLSLTRCKTLKNASLDNVEIVALLIDRTTGEIANAAKCKIGSSSLNGVENIDGASYSVRALDGRIAVDGEYNDVTVYTVDGKVAGKYVAGQPIYVAGGLYFVSVDGESAVKVIVK
ncbi:MAG: Omp28-related outer membrane protein [Bacteroidales bacterium]|nr:Omp28-related outer membrane protein [Bacteroidales bacterium]